MNFLAVGGGFRIYRYFLYLLVKHRTNFCCNSCGSGILQYTQDLMRIPTRIEKSLFKFVWLFLYIYFIYFFWNVHQTWISLNLFVIYYYYFCKIILQKNTFNYQPKFLFDVILFNIQLCFTYKRSQFGSK